MRSRLRRARNRIAILTLLSIYALLGLASVASAQERPSFVREVFKEVVLDPTTYAPAAIAYDATLRDWKSSQPFFARSYFERNERFTISGRPNDFPVSYAVGRNRILADALLDVQASAVNNMATRAFERALIERFPHRRKLVRTLGWIERISFASFLSYKLSAPHYRQASQNQRLARQLGYR